MNKIKKEELNEQQKSYQNFPLTFASPKTPTVFCPRIPDLDNETPKTKKIILYSVTS